MDLEAWGILTGLIITAVGGIWAAIRAASSAYAESVEKAATKIENERLAKQAEATVKAKNDEIEDLKERVHFKQSQIVDLQEQVDIKDKELARIWDLLDKQEGRG